MIVVLTDGESFDEMMVAMLLTMLTKTLTFTIAGGSVGSSRSGEVASRCQGGKS